METASSSEYGSLHFVLIPHLAHGHMIPMIDMARLLARRGPTVTFITTPLNAARFRSTVDRAAGSGLRLRLHEIPFPSSAAGLPEGCESMDSLPNRGFVKNLLAGIRMLREPVEELLGRLEPGPSCLIADKNIMWAHEAAGRFEVPRVVFDGTSCFSLLCTHRIIESKVYETVADDMEPFTVPGLPDRIELNRAQLPGAVNIAQSDTKDVREEIRSKEFAAYGVVVNTFEELEPAYVDEFKKVRGRVWCIGPVSMVNENRTDKAERGNRAAVDETRCLSWLDSWGPKSVIYVCLGSMSRPSLAQLTELGLGLEASGRPFIWAIRAGPGSKEFDDWAAESRFEGRVGERGLLVRGWAPQVLILSHPAVGGFLTHCGWNSTQEGVCAGVPMVTWPMFAEQFYNEKLAVQVLRVGVSLGLKFAVKWGEEDKFSGPTVKRAVVEWAVSELMGQGEEAQQRRKRAMELGEKAKKAMEGGGSSFLNLTLMIEDIKQQLLDH